MDPRLVNALTPVASSIHGVARSSLDIDILAALEPSQVADLVRRLEREYYVSANRVADAIEHETSFNAIHLETMFKVDVFIARLNEFRRSSIQRRKLLSVTDEREFFVTSPEDIVLHKLHPYRKAGEVSDRQRQDVVGVIKVQASSLDRSYLLEWAAKLGVADLLEQALSDAQ